MGLISTLIVLCCTVPLAQGLNVAPRIGALGFATNVLKFVNFVIGQTSDDSQIDQDKLLSDLEKHIDTAKTELFTSITLRSKLERVDDAVIAIHSSLIDVHNILTAQTGIRELVQIFEDRFSENNVIMHVRFLRTLLTYVSPGDNLNLITLVREGMRCASDSMNAFRSFYMHLIEDGALLDMIFLTLTTENVDLDPFYQDWIDVTRQADVIFAGQERICAQRFPSDVLIDLKANENVTVLRSELDKRYSDRNIDIFFYSGIGTNQFHALRYTNTTQNVFWDRDLNTVNKVLVVTDNNGKPNWNKAATKSKLEICLKNVSVDEEDNRAAEHVQGPYSPTRLNSISD